MSLDKVRISQLLSQVKELEHLKVKETSFHQRNKELVKENNIAADKLMNLEKERNFYETRYVLVQYAFNHSIIPCYHIYIYIYIYI